MEFPNRLPCPVWACGFRQEMSCTWLTVRPCGGNNVCHECTMREMTKQLSHLSVLCITRGLGEPESPRVGASQVPQLSILEQAEG
jgi:hypothetical protein